MGQRADLGHLRDCASHFKIAQRLARVIAEQSDPRVAAHVLLLTEAAHGVDTDVCAVVVTPDDGGLRAAVGHKGRQGGDGGAVKQVEKVGWEVSLHEEALRLCLNKPLSSTRAQTRRCCR